MSPLTNPNPMTLRLIALVALLTAATAAWAWCSPQRDKYETAPYKVISNSGEVEIREYPTLSLATAKMGDADKKGANRSFGSLFGYISGQNEDSAKISMTTPVFMDGGQMSFVLPEGGAASGAPDPKGDEVSLTRFPGGRFAVLRFAGSRSAKAEAKAEQKLREWATANGVKLSGTAVFAYYDPPFTLPPLRRNEVLVKAE